MNTLVSAGIISVASLATLFYCTRRMSKLRSQRDAARKSLEVVEHRLDSVKQDNRQLQTKAKELADELRECRMDKASTIPNAGTRDGDELRDDTYRD